MTEVSKNTGKPIGALSGAPSAGPDAYPQDSRQQPTSPFNRGGLVLPLPEFEAPDPNAPTPKPQPILIAARRGESTDQLYIRAERTGVGRKCTSCRAVRRFSKVQCHRCGSVMHDQVDGVHKINHTDEDYHRAAKRDDRNPMEGGFEFTPIGEMEDADEIRRMEIINDKRPLQERTVKELRQYAEARDIDLEDAKSKKDIIARLDFVEGFQQE